MTTSDELVTTIGDAGDPPDVEPDDDLDDERRGPGTALWIVLVVAALVFGGAIGWRITKDDSVERPGRTSVDVGFFQDMGTHHNQAIAMAFVYLEHGTDPLLRQIAGEILTYQASEIGVMNDHLADWNQQGTEGDTAMGWMGMRVPRDQMTGLATPEEMDELRTATGGELDQLFTRLMIDHHAGGIHMAQFAAANAETDTVRSWAKAMIEGQKGEIAELNRWRVQHGYPSVPVHI